MVAAGETGGILEETLQRVADQLEKDDALRRQIKAAMVYPALIVGFAVRRADRAGRVPRSRSSRTSSRTSAASCRRSPSSPSALSHLITDRWYLLIAGRCRDRLRLPSSGRSPTRGREQWDRFKLQVPFKIGDIVQKVALARFSRTFSALVAAGVPMLQAIDITGRTAGNRVDREGDGGRARLGQEGRHDRRADARRPGGLPADGHADGRRGRGDRRARDDARRRSPTSTRTRSPPRSRR